MVAGEHTEAAGKDTDTLVNTELQREVGDGPLLYIILPGSLPLKLTLHSMKLANVAGIAGKLLQPALRHHPQKLLDAAGDLAPEIRIDTDKQLDGERMPAPPDVVGKRFQKFELIRNPGSHIVKLKFHSCLRVVAPPFSPAA